MKGKPYRCKDCKYFTKTEHNKNDTRGRGLCKLVLNGTRRARGTGVYYYSDKECKYFDINSERNSTVYIHYGNSEYDPNHIDAITENLALACKMQGLWGSPVNAEYGWKEWCEDNEFRDCGSQPFFKFKLKPEAEVLHIYKEEDIMDYVEIPEDSWHSRFPRSFIGKTIDGRLLKDKLKQDYDAIELHIAQNYAALKYTIFNT